MLDSLGHRVSDFASAGELIAATKKEPYDGIITDIHMPGMSGFDLKRLLTATAKVPVIMITARGAGTRSQSRGLRRAWPAQKAV
jgi:FixJ family two-component response regulator